MHHFSLCICANVDYKSHFDTRNRCSNFQSDSREVPNDIEVQELTDRSEHLVYLMTHICTQKLTGIFRTQGSESDYCRCEARSPVVIQNGHSVFKESRPKNCGTSKMTQHRTFPDSSRSLACSPYQGGSCTCGLNQFTKNRCYSSSSDHRGLSLHHHNIISSNEDTKMTSRNFPILDWASSWHSLCWGRGPPTGVSCSRKKLFKLQHIYTFVFLLLAFSARLTECCSSRSTPKPRPASPTLRPNVTFQTYACPPAYAAWYCLNGATCFTVKIQDAILYNCECAEGYMGPRCEFKDPDGSYLHESQRVLLETASIAGGACFAILLVFSILFTLYVFFNKDKQKKRGLDDPFNDQRCLHSATEESPHWPQYIYSVSSYLTKGSWNSSYTKDLPRYLDIDFLHNSKPIFEVTEIPCKSSESPVIETLPGDMASDQQTHKLISVIVPK